MTSVNIIGFGKMGIQISSLLMLMGININIYTRNFDDIKKKKISCYVKSI